MKELPIPPGRHRCHCGRLCYRGAEGPRQTPMWSAAKTILKDSKEPIRLRSLHHQIVVQRGYITKSSVIISLKSAIKRGEPVKKVSRGYYAYTGKDT